MREIKFRCFVSSARQMVDWEEMKKHGNFYKLLDMQGQYPIMQFTGLTDKNGSGLIEVYEGDIIDVNGNLRGNTYEIQQRKTDLVIPRMGTREWNLAYKEAVARGFDFT